jgi:hypothetical protein
MSKLTIGSLVGGFCCLGLAVIPIPFDRWVGVRQVGSVGAIGCGILGWHESQRLKEEQEQLELWHFHSCEKQQAIDAAVNSAVADVLVQEVVTKEQLRAHASVEVYKAETQQNFVTVMAHDHPEILQQLLQNSEPPTTSETKTDSVSDIETKSDSISDSDSDVESVVKTAEEIKAEQIAAARSVLLKLIEEHEGGWIGQLMKKPILIYGDQGSFKSDFAAFLALCRHYLRGHEIISIADPHFHQKTDKCWEYLVKLGVPGYGANFDYEAIGGQLNAMYDRFKVRTEEDTPPTSIFDEATNYSLEEGSMEPASQLSRKIVSDPRKSNEFPVVIAHNNTNAAWGGGTGFSESLQGNVIQIKLLSTSEQAPVFRGTISGIKDEQGEFIKDFKISILPYWIRPDFVYNLFNPISTKPTIFPASPLTSTPPNADTITSNNKEYFLKEAQNWLAEVNGSVSGEVSKRVEEAEVSFTTQNGEVSEGKEVTSEVPEVPISNTFSVTSLLSEEDRSKALVAVISKSARKNLTMLKEVNTENTSTEVTQYMGARLRIFLTQKQDKTLLELRTADVPQKVKDRALVIRLNAHGP